ncbi:chemotaxis protein CheW [Hyphomicrobium sp. CS1GBMeth3]|uniref:hybrid sensor histidine kinase/response regulator n=1 Tax=Hyphomicrobium sp. CS1GBMeth3 TaxID=1892845 RepID=UPI00092FFD50|nr:chemotaxis protein CheW [Hyphomicrobium sp. CS1GBMeth3]
MDELLKDFLTETTEHIEGAETQLVMFERNPSDASLITSIFRLVHTIKGTSSFLGLERLERVGHAAESVMGMLRDGVPPTQHSVTIILAAIDRIKTIIEEIGQYGSEPPGDDSGIINALEAYYAAGSEAAAAAAASEASAKADAPVVSAIAEPAIVEHEPVASKAAPAPEVIAIAEATLEPTAAKETAKASDAAPAQGKAAGGSTANQESIRVSVETIERMMQLVSELVLSRNQLLEIARHREDDSIKTPLQHLSTLTSDLQDAVMRARMQPVGRLYANLPRLVRELSTSLGKSIDLVTEGADTELDRQLIEVIRDPLTHIIRNCADHGIEKPEDRVVRGKPERGEIRVSAAHEAGQITIDIADDGKGLDIERIKAKILAQGLATEQDLRAMSNEEIYRFIFEPGFSTAQVVSNVSGRGVGMDVVRTNIEAIGGSVSLSSVEGKGSRFSLRIPLTLAIAPALIIEVAGQRFALPQTSVVEAVSLGKNYKDLIQNVQNALVLKLREEVIPAVELRDVVALSDVAENEANDKLAVVMRVGTDSFCIIVDGVADIQEIVVKPLSASLAHLKVFSGHTILGDGSVVLILDPAGLAASLGIEKSTEKKRVETRDQSAYERRRLVMFKAGSGAPKVLPLSLVSRIEMVETDRIEQSDGRQMVLLQGRLMPIVPISPEIDMSKPAYPVLVVATDQRAIGLMADEIVDILEEKLEIQLTSNNSALVGSAEIRGEAVELIDVSHFIRMADSAGSAAPTPQRILFASDDMLVRDMLCPALSAAGYSVTATSVGSDINELLAQSATFDAVIIDTDTPLLASPAALRALQARKDAASIPAFGVSRNPTPRAARIASEHGLTALISKHERHMLLDTLAHALDAAADAKATSMELAA